MAEETGPVGLEQFEDFLDPTNYAAKEAIRKQAKEEVLSYLPSIRGKRNTIDERWRRLVKVWKGEHAIRYYQGEADLFIPMARKVCDTFVSQIKTQVFPEDPLYMIDPGASTDMQSALTVKKLLDHDIEQAELRAKTELFFSSGMIFGIGIIKSVWKDTYIDEYRRRVTEQSKFARFVGKEPQTEVVKERATLYQGPTFDVVNPMRFYVWPMTAQRIEDCEIVFEDMQTSYAHLKNRERGKVFWNVDRVLEPSKKLDNISTGSDESKTRRSAAVDADGITAEERILPRESYDLTEVWCKFDLYGAGKKVPCKMVVVDGEIVEIRANPMIGQRPPYRVWRVTDIFDNFYGQGKMQLMEAMQYALNALCNQGIDSANFQINQILMVNEMGLAEGLDSIKIAPRAMWVTTEDPNNVIKPFQIPDTTATAFSTMSLIISLMQDTAGAPPILQGKQGGSTTATEAQALAANAGAFTNNMASKLEAQVFSPMLMDWYRLEQQFRPLDTEMKITGAEPFRVPAADLAMDYTFRWFVSTQVPREMQVKQFENGLTAVPAGPEGAPAVPEGGGNMLEQMASELNG